MLEYNTLCIFPIQDITPTVNTLLESISNQSALIEETMEILASSDQHPVVLSILSDLIDIIQTVNQLVENSIVHE